MKKIGLIFLLATLFLSACREDFEYLSTPDTQSNARKEKIWMIKRVDGNVTTKGVAVKDKLWQAGDVIRIKFLNGEIALQEKVKEYAAIWLQYANLQFEYVATEEEADVKIGFDLDERWLSWSVTGTDCRQIPQDAPSLNFFELDMTDEEYLKGEILRGFGHVLGLGFEYRSPESPVVFNSKAENYFKNTCQLSDADVAELLALYNTDLTNYSEYDESSIMGLDIPKTILTFPKYTISSNTALSENDIQFITGLYPSSRDSIVVMVIQGKYVGFDVITDKEIEVDLGNGEKMIMGQGMGSCNYTYSDNIELHTVVVYGTNTAIKRFGFSGGRDNPKTLDISKNTALTDLICSWTPLETLDLSKNKALERLECMCNYSLRTLDLSNNTALTWLNCPINRLTSLDVSKNLALDTLVCHSNELLHLDVSKNVALQYLSCEQNWQMESLNLGDNPVLTTLICGGSQLTSLNISGLPLKHLSCGSNKLTILSLNTELEELSCPFNKLSTLDVSNCPYLKSLDCIGNLLTTLNISGNPAIERIYCYYNQIGQDYEGLVNFANSLPDRVGKSPGKMTADIGVMVPVAYICEPKNWIVR